MGFELPETLKLASQMEATLNGKALRAIWLSERCASLIRQGMCNLDRRKDEIIGAKIEAICARGKWIFLEFDNELLLLLGEIIGKLLYHDHKNQAPKASHVRFEFHDQTTLSFQSSLYAFLEVANREQMQQHKYAGHIGLAPNDPAFSYAHFVRLFEKYPKKPLKAFLNQQDEIAGLGNVYINDILYQARLHPKKKVSELTEPEKRTLYDQTVETITKAIALGGSSSEFDLFDQPGHYQRIMDNNRVGLPCGVCGTSIIKSNVLGSSAYICPECQKL